ncbi:hypothetical protein TI03_04155 [Achromatium sp. WMS1]|nr:hypothetical protein TI03_04155 [Achromatium sp. WMS1]
MAAFLLNEKRQTISDMERRQKVQITLVPNPHIERPHYKIQRIRISELNKEASFSYQMAESVDTNYQQQQDWNEFNRSNEEAAVKSIAPTSPIPRRPDVEQPALATPQPLLHKRFSFKSSTQEGTQSHVKGTIKRFFSSFFLRMQRIEDSNVNQVEQTQDTTTTSQQDVHDSSKGSAKSFNKRKSTNAISTTLNNNKGETEDAEQRPHSVRRGRRSSIRRGGRRSNGNDRSDTDERNNDDGRSLTPENSETRGSKKKPNTVIITKESSTNEHSSGVVEVFGRRPGSLRRIRIPASPPASSTQTVDAAVDRETKGRSVQERKLQKEPHIATELIKIEEVTPEGQQAKTQFQGNKHPPE